MHDHELTSPDSSDPAAPQAGPSPEGGGGVLDILAQFETQMNRLREAQHEHQEQVAALERRVATVAEQEQATEALRCELESQQQALLAERTTFDEESRQLESRLAELESRRRDFEESQQRQREEIRSLSQCIEEERTVLSELEHELFERRRGFEMERDQWEEHRQQRTQELESLRQQEDDRVARAQAEIDQLQSRARDLEAQLEKARHDIQTRETLLDEMRHEYQLEYDRLIQVNEEQRQQHASAASDLQSRVAGAVAESAETAEQAGHLRRELEEKTRRLEEGQAQREELQAQIERLRQDLEAGTGDADEVRDERLADLTARLEQAQAHSAEMQQRVDQAENNVGELVGRLEHTGGELEAKQRELDDAREQAESMRGRVEQLTEDLRQRGDENEAIAARDARIAELTAQLERLQGDLEARGDDAGGGEALAERDVRITELTAELDQLRDASTASEAQQATIESLRAQLAAAEQVSSGDAEAAQRLRSKTRRLSAAAEHLRRRHKRLRSLRKALRLRRQSAQASTAQREKNEAAVRRIQQERFELTELRKILAASEQKMVRRWARQKATITCGWLIVMAVVVGVASWFGTGLLFPRQVTASVTVAAKTRDGTSLSPSEAEGWKHWHAEILGYESFHQQLAKRLTDRQLKEYATSPLAGRRLAQDLTVDDAAPDRLTLTLAGTDRKEVTYFLDTVATTLSIQSGREITKRDDGARADILGEHQKGGRLAYATLNPLPLTQAHLIKFGVVFAVGMSLCLVVVGFIYTRLTKAKRVFDDDELVDVEIVLG